MQFMQENQTEQFLEHDDRIKAMADVVIGALLRNVGHVTTEAVIYYGLFQRGLGVDDAAKVMNVVSADERIERSGVLIFIGR